MPDRNIFRKILFCTDFSDKVDPAFRYAVNLAGGGPHRELVIFHVVPEPSAQFWKTYISDSTEIDVRVREEIDAKVREAYLERIPPGLTYSVRIARGRPGEAILEAAEAEDVDLIVMGRHGTSVFKTHFFGNTTERIARKSLRPLLIVPVPEKK